MALQNPSRLSNVNLRGEGRGEVDGRKLVESKSTY